MNRAEIVEMKLAVASLSEKVRNIAGKAGAHASVSGEKDATWQEVADQLSVLQTNVGQALKQVKRNIPQ